MDIERKNSSIIRDILIKVVLIVLFVFLLTFLFPMPNLTTFYDAVFNNNIQTMKEAAEDYFTTDRMPTELGKEETLTLQDMLDKKLILPFVDKDGKVCDTKKSYVTVRKDEKEYVLKVYLSCNGKSDYIIEPIGCYNFCPDGKCSTDVVKTDEKTGEVTVNVPTNNKKTNTNKNNTTTNSDPKYKLQYLYARTITRSKWTIGDFDDTKLKENSNLKLVDTRTLYTGQKKVESGTNLYKHVKYDYKDKWTYDTDWTDEIKSTNDNVQLIGTRTQYTGQKKITSGTTLYKHVKYSYRDKWTYDTDWTDEVKKETDNLKLIAKRTLYTGQKRVERIVNKYKHIKYAYRDNWTETSYTTEKKQLTKTVVLADTRYTVRRTIKRTTGTWGDWTLDTTWRTSKPADTATKQWSGPAQTKETVSWQTVYNSYRSVGVELPTYSGDTWNEFLYSANEKCTINCGGKSEVRVYYYRVHKKQRSYTYLYNYRTYSESSKVETDEKTVSDPSSYVKIGYTVIKTEYKYRINNREKYIADTKWTESRTSPKGYEYANERRVTTVISYENLGKWVTSKEKLGEYTYNVKTRTQYKYRYNNPEKYISNTIWTTSITPPAGYTYTGESKTETKTTYADLGRWVNSKEDLGEYTHNIRKKTQYKYRYNNPEKYIYDTVWTTSITPPAGYTYTGEYKTETNTSYADLGKWVKNKKDLGEYTYNIEKKTQYKYKRYSTITTIEKKWFDKDPGGDWVYANKTRKIMIN